jgi:hypothetical protein
LIQAWQKINTPINRVTIEWFFIVACALRTNSKKQIRYNNERFIMKIKTTIVTSSKIMLFAGLSFLTACSTTAHSGNGGTGGPGPSTSSGSAATTGDSGSTWTASQLSACAASLDWVSNPTLPTDVASGQSNCNFQQFMWQSLFYLIQPTTDIDVTTTSVREFETWMPSYGMFVDEGKTPAPWGTIAHPVYCEVPTGVEANYVFSDLTLQAGSHHPLIAKDLHDVFYNLSVNQPAYNFITGCDLYKEQCGITLAPDLLNPTTTPIVDIPVKYPQLAFPEQSIELKTSWKILTPVELASNNFYTTNGSVKSPEQECLTNVTLGLVGMHIVSKTPTHPEFIWATFEHKNNAPDCANPTAAAPLGGDWTFYDQNCTGDCTTNEYTPKKATQVCRMHPWGDSTMGTFPNGLNCDSTPPPGYICDEDVQKYIIEPNTANLIAINKSVAGMTASLPDNNLNKLWGNYELVGNQWTRNGVLPPDLQSQLGSLSNANTTMETYVQNGVSNMTNPASCFGCHNLNGKSLTSSSEQASEPVQLPPAGLSHIFNLIKANTTGCKNGTELPSSPYCPVNNQ